MMINLIRVLSIWSWSRKMVIQYAQTHDWYLFSVHGWTVIRHCKIDSHSKTSRHPGGKMDKFVEVAASGTRRGTVIQSVKVRSTNAANAGPGTHCPRTQIHCDCLIDSIRRRNSFQLHRFSVLPSIKLVPSSGLLCFAT
jgi:hypothetical protein